MKANYHTHTYRCQHATMDTDEEYVKRAIEAHFDELTFTDHVPFEKVDINPRFIDRMNYDQIDEYIDSINSLKEKYKEQISIHVGFECEYFRDRKDYYKELYNKVDCLILGQHYPKCLGDDYWYGSTDETLDELISLVDEGLNTGYFKILAHPDYFMIGRDNWNAKCEEVAHRFGELLEKTQIPAEINLSGIKKEKRMIDNEMVYPYPFKKMWNILKDYNIRVIMGYDAHDPKALLDESAITKSLAIIKEYDLNIIDHIEL